MSERILKLKQSIEKDQEKLQKLQLTLKMKEEKLQQLQQTELLKQLNSIVVDGFNADEIIQAIKGRDTDKLFALMNQQKENVK